MKKLLAKAQAALLKAEPSWLANKRKAVIPPIVAGATQLLATHGIHLTGTEATALAVVVGGVVTWAIPNRPKLAADAPQV